MPYRYQDLDESIMIMSESKQSVSLLISFFRVQRGEPESGLELFIIE